MTFIRKCFGSHCSEWDTKSRKMEKEQPAGNCVDDREG